MVGVTDTVTGLVRRVLPSGLTVETDTEFRHETGGRGEMPSYCDGPMWQQADPRRLTDRELIKRLEYQMNHITDRLGYDVEVERLSPIAFRISDVGEKRQHIHNQFSVGLLSTALPGACYGVHEDAEGRILVWARHLNSYAEWEDEEEEYRNR